MGPDIYHTLSAYLCAYLKEMHLITFPVTLMEDASSRNTEAGY